MSLPGVQLPVPHVFRLVLTARQDQHVPALATTALHGALGHALRALACVVPGECVQCRLRPSCAYTRLFSPIAEVIELGVRGEGPSPVVLAPERTALGAPSLALRAGEELAFRVVVLGRAVEHAGLLRAALDEAVFAGLGSTATHAQEQERFELASFTLESPHDPGPAPARAEIQFLTPLRLKDDGKIAGHLDAGVLWRSLTRRLQILAATGEPPSMTVELPEEPDFTLEETRVRVVHVQRTSSRQGAKMTWPGLIGRAVLQGPGLAQAWPALRYAELCQVGKGTSFGFGRFAVTATQ